MGQGAGVNQLNYNGEVGIFARMSFKEIEQEAIALPEKQRASLVSTLLETLSPLDLDVTDEEVGRRDAELESGAVQPITHEELVRRVNEARKR